MSTMTEGEVIEKLERALVEAHKQLTYAHEVIASAKDKMTAILEENEQLKRELEALRGEK